MITKPTIYTREFVLGEVTHLRDFLKENKAIFFIGQLLYDRGYSRQRFSEWARQFSDDEEISDIIKEIRAKIETNLASYGLQGKLNPAMTIFTLKNHHGWKDKTEVEHGVSSTLADLVKKVYAGETGSENTE